MPIAIDDTFVFFFFTQLTHILSTTLAGWLRYRWPWILWEYGNGSLLFPQRSDTFLDFLLPLACILIFFLLIFFCDLMRVPKKMIVHDDDRWAVDGDDVRIPHWTQWA